jgi:integrase
MTQSYKPSPSPESEKGMRKRKASDVLLTSGASKFSPSYWAGKIFRPTYTNGDGTRDEVAEWYAQLQFSGRREKIGLGTNHKEDAARKAAKVYEKIRVKGWDAALNEIRPNSTPKCATTIGDFLNTVEPLLKVRARSFANYSYALRKIAIEATSTADRSKGRFNPKQLQWRDKVDELPLSKLTPTAIEKWKSAFVEEAGENPVMVQRARHSANSFIRNARALFSKRVLKRLKELSVPLPSPLPFEGVEMEPKGNTRYLSSIDASKLIQTARAELSETDPESWKVILLALGAGLRKSEIDGLCWKQIDLNKNEIRILNHAHFEAKTDDSIGSVVVDSGLLAELDKVRGVSGLSVVNPDREHQSNRSNQYYRCEPTFDRVVSWLRKQGVSGDKPLHSLRKEFGSLVCAASDIFVASRQLRHSNLATTESYYVDKRNRTTVPIGTMLQPAKEAK